MVVHRRPLGTEGVDGLVGRDPGGVPLLLRRFLPVLSDLDAPTSPAIHGWATTGPAPTWVSACAVPAAAAWRAGRWSCSKASIASRRFLTR